MRKTKDFFFSTATACKSLLEFCEPKYIVFLKAPEKKSHFVDKILFFTDDQIIKGSGLNKEVIVSGNRTKDAFSTKQFTGL